MKTLVAILILDVLSFTTVSIYINTSLDQMARHTTIARPAEALGLK